MTYIIRNRPIWRCRSLWCSHCSLYWIQLHMWVLWSRISFRRSLALYFLWFISDTAVK